MPCRISNSLHVVRKRDFGDDRSKVVQLPADFPNLVCGSRIAAIENRPRKAPDEKAYGAHVVVHLVGGEPNSVDALFLAFLQAGEFEDGEIACRKDGEIRPDNTVEQIFVEFVQNGLQADDWK